ncbi:MAG: histidine phosphotransferase family protein [Pseudomonadota bacterium]
MHILRNQCKNEEVTLPVSDTHDVQFASLLASRLCHDLVNPAGALSTALDVLANESDPDMLSHAQSLMNESSARLLAVIEFSRLAYGASGGDGHLDTESLRVVSEKLFGFLKPELQWNLPPSTLLKADARVLLNLLLSCERVAPRAGSVVTIDPAGALFVITATGKRAGVPDDMAAVFEGSSRTQEPKLMPAQLAQRLAESTGKCIVVESGEESARLLLA